MLLRAVSPLLTFALSASALPTRSFAPRACNVTLLFDGRIQNSTVASDFDGTSSAFNNGAVFGQNQKWSDIIKFPDVSPSLFDIAAGTKPFEVTIGDDSVFAPGGKPQHGLRRSELIPAINDGTDATVQGLTTIHWSLRLDPSRPLNFSHEYQLVFHEASDSSTNQFVLKTGTPLGQTFEESKHRTLRLEGRQPDGATLFSTPFDDNAWHNFAVSVSWNSRSITIFHSKDFEPLGAVNVTTNDNSGQGQQHFGISKLPIGENGIDVAHGGYQETGIDEGVIYGGKFIEDSSNGCMILS